MSFMKYLDDKDKTVSELTIEVKEKKVIKKTIKEQKNIKSEVINELDDKVVRHKLILELNRFGLNNEAINEILINVFSKSNTKTVVGNLGTFKENVNKLKIKPKVKNNPIDHASLILDGVEDMSSPQNDNNINNSIDESNLNMDNTRDHASALLM